MNLLERVAAYGLLAGAVLFGIHQYGNARAQQALAQQRADSLETVTRKQVSNDEVRAKADSAARDTLLSFRLQAIRATKIALTLKQRADSLVAADTVKKSADQPRLSENVRSALAVKDSVIGLQAAQITDLGTTVRILGTRWRAADSASTAWKALALAGQSQLAAALKASKPSRFGCVAGLALAGSLKGVGAPFGVACGISL